MKLFLEKPTLKGLFAWFIVCCLFWLVVLADWSVSFRNTWGTDAPNINNKLSAETWNAVLEELDKLRADLSWALQDPSIAIPNWAIMAFDLQTWCPDWWEIYEVASWRFLMWVNEANLKTVWLKGGSPTTRLKAGNIPPHNHFYKDTVYSESYVEDGSETQFIRSNYITALKNGNYATSPIKIISAWTADLPYGSWVIEWTSTPYWALPWSDEWYDVDNLPYYWIRQTSDAVCWYSDFRAAWWGKVYWSLKDFWWNKLNNYINNHCNTSYYADHFSIEYSNVKVLYCKKVSKAKETTTTTTTNKSCSFNGTSYQHGKTLSVYLSSLVTCENASSKCEKRTVNCNNWEWYYNWAKVSYMYSSCSTVDYTLYGESSTSCSCWVSSTGFVSKWTTCSTVYACKTCSSSWWGGWGWCFLSGTKVLVEWWEKDIEEINTWDLVLSYNIKTWETEYKKVIETLIHENNEEELYELSINWNILKVTSLHKFYLKGNIYDKNCFEPLWRSALKLRIGDILQMADWSEVIIENIIHYSHKGTVYNLEIEDNHNYYVDKWYLVHNSMQAYQKMVDDLVVRDM